MNLLIDTCAFLWLISDAPELSQNARQLFTNTENQVYLNVASAWEIIVKNKLGIAPPARTGPRFCP